MDIESRALAPVDEEPATAAASGADRPRLAVQGAEVHDFAADPEVQDFDGSLIQAIDEGIVEKPPLRPFRESAHDRFDGCQSWLQWRRDEGMRPERPGEGSGWRAKESRLWRDAMQHCYGADWRSLLDQQ